MITGCSYRSARAASRSLVVFFFNDPATTEIYTLSLHDALPISLRSPVARSPGWAAIRMRASYFHRPNARLTCTGRSEEHTSELQSRPHLVCRLLLEKKKHLASVKSKAFVMVQVG